MNQLFAILTFGLLFTFNVEANSNTNNIFWVKTSSFQCVLSKISEYLALDKDPVIVFFDICPRVEPNIKEILDVSKNSLPKIKNSIAPNSESVVRILALSKEELTCLSQMDSDRAIPESLKIPGTEIYATKISLENCKTSKKKVSMPTGLQ